MPRGSKRTSGTDGASNDDGKPAIGTDSGTVASDATAAGNDGNESNGPGRPEPVELGSNFESIEPSTVPIGEPPKKRGRRSKAELIAAGYYSKGGSAEETPRSLVDLTTLLLSLHQMGAAILNIQELELDREEARNMGDAIKEVAKFYPLAISPKKIAIANLVIVAGGIYGTRAIAYRERAKNERQTRGGPRVEEIRQPAGSGANGAPQGPAPTNPSEIWPLAPDENVSI